MVLALQLQIDFDISLLTSSYAPFCEKRSINLGFVFRRRLRGSLSHNLPLL